MLAKISENRGMYGYCNTPFTPFVEAFQVMVSENNSVFLIIAPVFNSSQPISGCHESSSLLAHSQHCQTTQLTIHFPA